MATESTDLRTETRSAVETEAVGARLAERLEPGDVVILSGEVGAGKTTLIRGAARALGVVEPVTSPTFTIGQRYAGGRLPISHLDLYRLEDLEGEDRGEDAGQRRAPRERRESVHGQSQSGNGCGWLGLATAARVV